MKALALVSADRLSPMVAVVVVLALLTEAELTIPALAFLVVVVEHLQVLPLLPLTLLLVVVAVVATITTVHLALHPLALTAWLSFAIESPDAPDRTSLLH